MLTPELPFCLSVLVFLFGPLASCGVGLVKFFGVLPVRLLCVDLRAIDEQMVKIPPTTAIRLLPERHEFWRIKLVREVVLRVSEGVLNLSRPIVRSLISESDPAAVLIAEVAISACLEVLDFR